MKTILSLDGGGIRGLLPARVLAKLEELAGKPCCELFDLIAGTSTGGILALALAMRISSSDPPAPRYRAADLVDLYRQNGARIFDSSVGSKISSLFGVTGAKYGAAGIEAVLKDYFGEAQLQSALTKVLVTSYDTLAPGPKFFKSWRPEDAGHLMRDVARATSAAPTYFPPFHMGQMCLIDGGVFANNPAMCACAEFAADSSDLVVVSLGTGNTEKRVSPGSWGLAGWAQPLVEILMDGVSDFLDYQMRELLGAGRYFRFQTDLSGVSQAMDDASPATVEKLVQIGDELAAREIDSLNAAVKLLNSRRG